MNKLCLHAGWILAVGKENHVSVTLGLVVFEDIHGSWMVLVRTFFCSSRFSLKPLCAV